MRSGLWLFKLDGFKGWNGHDHGMPNISSVQDYDRGPVVAAAATSGGQEHAVTPRLGALAAGLLLLVVPAGPYDIALHPTTAAPGAEGRARLIPTDSPFGVGVTADGHASYNITITASRLPRPDSLGRFTAYVAWAVLPDLSQWVRLGLVNNGTSTVGPGGAQQVPARHHGRVGLRGGRAHGPHRTARHLAERLAAIVRDPSALPRHHPMSGTACARLVRATLGAAVAASTMASSSLAAQQPAQQPAHDMRGMKDMPGMAPSDTAMAMPVPMPRGMAMMPGLVGLTPAVASFVPGGGSDPMRLPVARPASLTPLRRGDTLDLTAALLRRTIRGHAFAMYGFNGQVPGPLIRVPQGATITVRFHNRIDLPSSVHWHGVRLDNRSDGAVGVTQEPVPPGGDFVYTVRFPDAGVYWYHPHVREDIEQAMGLVGNMLVDSPEQDYYSPANQEQALVLGDLLMQRDTLIPYGREAPDFTLMGRVGNLLLVNGEPDYTLHVHRGEVVRFYLTNAASSRTFNLSFGGAPIKVLASDVSRFEREVRVPSVVLAPAERYIAEVRFDRPGRYPLVNAVQAINHYRGEFEAQVGYARRRDGGFRAGHAGPRRRVRPTPRQRRGVQGHRAVPALLRHAARQAPHADRAHVGAAARHSSVHDDRYRLLRAGRVGGRHAGHELALDLGAGALDFAGRRDG